MYLLHRYRSSYHAWFRYSINKCFDIIFAVDKLLKVTIIIVNLHFMLIICHHLPFLMTKQCKLRSLMILPDTQ